MRVLFIVPYPQGQAASQRFRFEQYLPVLKEKEVHYTFSSFWSADTWAILYKEGNGWRKLIGLLRGFIRRIATLTQLYLYDFVFIHREATPIGPPWFEWLAAKVFRKKIIFDFDDAIWLPNTTTENRKAKGYKWHSKTANICRWSYKISCGNKYLQAYAQQYNTNTVILPTTIDTEQQHNKLKKHQAGKVTIGWTGSHSTLPYLKLIEPVLLQLEQKYAFEFIVIADKKPELQLRSWQYLPWQKETEVEDLLKLDIGVMPLPDTEWAKGKCAFKALQYMALGIPAVASGVGANIEAIPHGIAGFLCSTDTDWDTYLERLLLEPELRTTFGLKGREHVQQKFSVHSNKITFLKLFDKK